MPNNVLLDLEIKDLPIAVRTKRSSIKPAFQAPIGFRYWLRWFLEMDTQFATEAALQ